MSQEVRDAVGTLLLQLTLKELFQWRFMQTDPNWGNFLFDGDTGILHLIDFGAHPLKPGPWKLLWQANRPLCITVQSQYNLTQTGAFSCFMVTPASPPYRFQSPPGCLDTSSGSQGSA